MTGKAAKKSLADFRLAHDKDTIVPTKIKDALAKLGPDAWEYEIDFAKSAGVSSNDMAKYRDQFLDFVVIAKLPTGKGERRVWAGSKPLAAKMREMV